MFADVPKPSPGHPRFAGGVCLSPNRQGLTDIARHVIGCHSIQAMNVQNPLDDVASSIHQSLTDIARHVIGCQLIRVIKVQNALMYMTWRARHAAS
jgi:hypothetical protein